jgi:hypothetical protein
LYPVEQLPAERRAEIVAFEATIGRFVDVLLNHVSPKLQGRRLGDIWPTEERRPERLIELHQRWADDLGVMARQPPSLVFATLGQAKASGVITPETESRLLRALLNAWAVRSSLDGDRNRSAATHLIRRPAIKIA